MKINKLILAIAFLCVAFLFANSAQANISIVQPAAGIVANNIVIPADDLGTFTTEFFNYINTEVGWNFQSPVTFPTVTIGKQGVGGVTYFNGTIINNTTNASNEGMSVTFGDNVNIDGYIHRDRGSGDVMINDNLAPWVDDYYTLGAPGRRWKTLYVQDINVQNGVVATSLEGHTYNEIISAVSGGGPESDPIWMAAEPDYANLLQNELITGDWTYRVGANGKVTFDARTIDHLDTRGVIDIELDAGADWVGGINLDLDSKGAYVNVGSFYDLSGPTLASGKLLGQVVKFGNINGSSAEVIGNFVGDFMGGGINGNLKLSGYVVRFGDDGLFATGDVNGVDVHITSAEPMQVDGLDITIVRAKYPDIPSGAGTGGGDMRGAIITVKDRIGVDNLYGIKMDVDLTGSPTNSYGYYVDTDWGTMNCAFCGLGSFVTGLDLIGSAFDDAEIALRNGEMISNEIDESILFKNPSSDSIEFALGAPQAIKTSSGSLTLDPGVIIGPGGTEIEKHLSATGGLDFSVPPQRCHTLSMPVGGALPGDTVVATPGSVGVGLGIEFFDLTWIAWVSNPGMVSVKACNGTITGNNPALQSWRADVWQH